MHGWPSRACPGKARPFEAAVACELSERAAGTAGASAGEEHIVGLVGHRQLEVARAVVGGQGIEPGRRHASECVQALDVCHVGQRTCS